MYTYQTTIKHVLVTLTYNSRVNIFTLSIFANKLIINFWTHMQAPGSQQLVFAICVRTVCCRIVSILTDYQITFVLSSMVVFRSSQALPKYKWCRFICVRYNPRGLSMYLENCGLDFRKQRHRISMDIHEMLMECPWKSLCPNTQTPGNLQLLFALPSFARMLRVLVPCLTTLLSSSFIIHVSSFGGAGFKTRRPRTSWQGAPWRASLHRIEN